MYAVHWLWLRIRSSIVHCALAFNVTAWDVQRCHWRPDARPQLFEKRAHHRQPLDGRLQNESETPQVPAFLCNDAANLLSIVGQLRKLTGERAACVNREWWISVAMATGG